MKQEILNKIKEIEIRMKTMNSVEKMVVEHFELYPLYVALGKLVAEEKLSEL